jgi:hypothetical protein
MSVIKQLDDFIADDTKDRDLRNALAIMREAVFVLLSNGLMLRDAAGEEIGRYGPTEVLQEMFGDITPAEMGNILRLRAERGLPVRLVGGVHEDEAPIERRDIEVPPARTPAPPPRERTP